MFALAFPAFAEASAGEPAIFAEASACAEASADEPAGEPAAEDHK